MRFTFPNINSILPNISDHIWNNYIFIRYARKLNLTNVFQEYSAKFNTSIKDHENSYPIEVYLKNMEQMKYIRKNLMDYNEGLKMVEELCQKHIQPQNINQNNTNPLISDLNLNKIPDIYNKNDEYEGNEIFASYNHMKGYFQYKLGKIKEAHESFKTACECNQTDYKIYTDWSEMSENVLITLKGTKLETTWFENSLINNFMTIIFKLDKAKFIIPKIFYLIKKFPKQIIGEKFEKYLEQIPTWIWIFFIPQIFELLKIGIINNKNTFSMFILRKIANKYPQYLIYNLTFLLNSNLKDTFNLTKSEDIEIIKSNLIELKEIINDPEKPVEPIKKIDIIMEEINKKMEKYYDDIFLNHFINFISFRNTKNVDDYASIIKKYTAHLNNIKNVGGDYIPNILSEFDKLFQRENYDMCDLYEKIKNWRYFINSKRATRTNFREISQILEKNLCNLNFEDVEIPGFFTNKMVEPTEENIVYIGRFESEFNFKFLNYSNKKLIIRGSNEKLYSFKIISEFYGKDSTDYKISQMQYLLNQIFMKNKDAYKNNIKFNLPIKFQITNLYKIVQEDSLFYSLDEVYDFSMQKMGYDPEVFINFYKEEFKELYKDRKIENLENHEVIKRVYSRMKNILPAYNMKNFVHKFIINCDEIFIFRKQFATSYALNNLFCYLFKLQDEMYLDRITFNKETGSITLHGMKYFKYDNLVNLLYASEVNNSNPNIIKTVPLQVKNLIRKEIVPLRLSRNINVWKI